MKIGRNAPCPCGSRKKFKRCCGVLQSKKKRSPSTMDAIELAGRLAYVGSTGAARRRFCRNYIIFKSKLIDDIAGAQYQYAIKSNEIIQCRKGCHFCCAHYVGGTLQECEAIVYYLYQNDHALSIFLLQYPAWRSKIKRNEKLFRHTGQAFEQMVSRGYDNDVAGNQSELSNAYLRQNIYCPFIFENACVIYQVRPKACAALFSTSDPQWCDPLNQNNPRQLSVTSGQPDPPYYYGNPSNVLLANVPVMVYEILKGGYIYLSSLPSMQKISDAALGDSEAQGILANYHYLVR